jgi:predicted RNA-binding Zn-ribbon protein involved in translation (DUF1610 family)
MSATPRALDVGDIFGSPFTERPEAYCPACGRQSIWQDSSDDLYYGCTFFCLACGAEGPMWDVARPRTPCHTVVRLRKEVDWKDGEG